MCNTCSHVFLLFSRSKYNKHQAVHWYVHNPFAWAVLCMEVIFRWSTLMYESQTLCWNKQKIFSTNILHQSDGKYCFIKYWMNIFILHYYYVSYRKYDLVAVEHHHHSIKFSNLNKFIEIV